MNTNTLVREVIENEAFRGLSQLLFPSPLSKQDEEVPLRAIAPLFPRNTCFCADDTVIALNYLLKLHRYGMSFFYNIYSDREKRRDPAKRGTGLFFCRGVRGAPFALIAPGCGEYVTLLHEGLPCAVELIRPGFNAFVLHYRTGSKISLCEDLAAALSFIFARADELGVSTDGYTLWGSSAGADAAAYLASYGAHGFGGDDLPRPSALFLQYTSHVNHTRREPPTFACVGERDDAAVRAAMKKRIDELAACGIDTAFHEYAGVGTGFGLGRGTTAEGWIGEAVQFWKKHLPQGSRRKLRRQPAVRLVSRH